MYFFLSMYVCVYMHYVHVLCLQRPEGARPSRTGAMDSCKPQAYPVGASARAANALSVLTSPQPLLGHFRLHIWLVLFFCNRTAPEAADPTMQVSPSFHISFIFTILKITHLKHINVPELKFTPTRKRTHLYSQK